MIKVVQKVIVFAIGIIGILSCSIFDNEDSLIVHPDILFHDDFSDHRSGWDRVNDRDKSADYEHGAYRIFVNSENSVVWANPGLSFEDSIVEVEATKIGGLEDNDFGLICRFQGLEGFYSFIITSDGFYAITKWNNGQQVIISSEYMEYSDHINQGSAVNLIQAECVGSTLKLSVNDNFLVEVTDSDFQTGDVGLIAGTFNNHGTDIKFDNFVVKKP